MMWAFLSLAADSLMSKTHSLEKFLDYHFTSLFNKFLWMSKHSGMCCMALFCKSHLLFLQLEILLDPSLITSVEQDCLLLFLLWWRISYLPLLSPNIDSLGTQQQAEEWQTCCETNARGLIEATKLCSFENIGKLSIIETTNVFFSFTLRFELFVLIIYTSVTPVLLSIHSLTADSLGLGLCTHPNQSSYWYAYFLSPEI